MKITVNLTRNTEWADKKPYGYVAIYLNDEFYLNSFQIRKNLSNDNYFVSTPGKYYTDKEGVEKSKAVIEVQKSFKGVADKIIEAYKELEEKNEKTVKLNLGDEQKPYFVKATTYLKPEVDIKNGKIIGKAKININDMFTINDVSVIRDNKQEIQILYPSYQKTNEEGIKEFKEFCNPITADCRTKVLDAVKESVVKAEEWQKNHPKEAAKEQTESQEQNQSQDAPVQ